MSSDSPVRGSCLCGQVVLNVERLDRDVVYCHCSQCRKQSGLYYAATRARDADLTIDGEENVTWFAASTDARRGFCRYCGSLLFWKSNDSEYTSILAGCLDAPTGLKAAAHIYTEDQGDYYVIDDGLPQWPQSDS